jgi:hypothetical protein
MRSLAQCLGEARQSGVGKPQGEDRSSTVPTTDRGNENGKIPSAQHRNLRKWKMKSRAEPRRSRKAKPGQMRSLAQCLGEARQSGVGKPQGEDRSSTVPNLGLHFTICNVTWCQGLLVSRVFVLFNLHFDIYNFQFAMVSRFVSIQLFCLCSPFCGLRVRSI